MLRPRNKLRWAAPLFLSGFPFASFAALAPLTPVPLAEGPCEIAAGKYEKTYHIPKGLLRAVATHESGRYVRRLSRRVSWPWTTNVGGEGYYFNDRATAAEAVRIGLEALGPGSVDVGCMQLNMKYHGHAFASVNAALAPDANVRYAASFLRARYDVRKNWFDAVSDYHNNQRDIGGAYMEKVVKLWKKQRSSLSVADVARFEGAGGTFGDVFLYAAPSPLPDLFGALALGYRRFYGDME